MKMIKYGCAFLALTYLVYALLPHLIIAQHGRTGKIFPEWFNRIIDIVYACLYGTISYGLHKRTEFYWRLIPILVAVDVLSRSILAAIWFGQFSKFSGSLMLPVTVFITLSFAFVAFKPWWQNQKRDYFSEGRQGDG